MIAFITVVLYICGYLGLGLINTVIGIKYWKYFREKDSWNQRGTCFRDMYDDGVLAAIGIVIWPVFFLYLLVVVVSGFAPSGNLIHWLVDLKLPKPKKKTHAITSTLSTEDITYAIWDLERQNEMRASWCECIDPHIGSTCPSPINVRKRQRGMD